MAGEACRESNEPLLSMHALESDPSSCFAILGKSRPVSVGKCRAGFVCSSMEL
jgi:hypothetical protein